MSSYTDVVKVGFYCIGKTVGKGNSSIVKHAIHAITKSEVAIKIIDKGLFETDSSLEQVKREINALKSLRHPNIIKLYQVMESDKFIYLISEYVPNGEIFEYIANHGKFPEKVAKLKFAQIVNAVDYCHQRGVVHRDLKAENLLLDAEFNVKLADFGFSNHYHNDHKLSTWCGSPPYAAPEIFEGHSYVGPEVDIWSLGVILYVLVCGMLPFDGDNLRTVKDRVVSGRFRIPFFMSTECERLLRKILVVDPRKRYSMEQIKAHVWLKDAMTQVTGLEESFREQLVVTGKGVSLNCHDMVLKRMQEAKIDKDRVLQSLQTHRYDNFSAIYELLLDRIARHIKQYPQSRLSAAGLRRPSMISEQVMLSRRVQGVEEKDEEDEEVVKEEDEEAEAVGERERRREKEREQAEREGEAEREREEGEVTNRKKKEDTESDRGDGESDEAASSSDDRGSNEAKAPTKLVETREAVFSQTTDGVSLHEVAGPLCQLQQRVRCHGDQDDVTKELSNPSGGSGVMIMPTSPIRPKLTRSPRLGVAARCNRKKMSFAEGSIDEGVETEEEDGCLPPLQAPQRPPCHPCNSIDSNIEVDLSASNIFLPLEQLLAKDEAPSDCLPSLPPTSDLSNFRKGRRASDGLVMKLDSLAAQNLFLKNRACGLVELRKELVKLQNQTVQQPQLQQLRQELQLLHNTQQQLQLLQKQKASESQKLTQRYISKDHKPLINNSYIISKIQKSLEEQQNNLQQAPPHNQPLTTTTAHRQFRKQPYNKVHSPLEHQPRPLSPLKGSFKRHFGPMRPLPSHFSHRCTSPSIYADTHLSSASTSPIRGAIRPPFSPTISSAAFNSPPLPQAYYNSNLSSFPPSVCQSGGNILNNSALGSPRRKPSHPPTSIFPLHITAKQHLLQQNDHSTPQHQHQQPQPQQQHQHQQRSTDASQQQYSELQHKSNAKATLQQHQSQQELHAGQQTQQQHEQLQLPQQQQQQQHEQPLPQQLLSKEFQNHEQLQNELALQHLQQQQQQHLSQNQQQLKHLQYEPIQQQHQQQQHQQQQQHHHEASPEEMVISPGNSPV